MNSILNNGTTSGVDLENLAKAIDLKVKIMLLYDLENIDKLDNGNYIVLITPNKNILSGHYVCMKVFKFLKTKYIYYFDSFGMPAPDIIEDIADKNKYYLYYNDKQVQAINMEHCGQFCVYLLKMVDKCKTPNEYVDKLNKYLSKFYIYN